MIALIDAVGAAQVHRLKTDRKSPQDLQNQVTGPLMATSGDGDSIRVFVRVRPLVADTSDVDRGLCLDVNGTCIVMRAKPEDKVFTFDDVADQQSTQESIFCSVGKKIIDGCVGGYNGTIFAYGQTGSGKTFTMLGPHEDSGCFQHELRGVIPRGFDYLFKLLQKEQEVNGAKMEYMCKCTFLEIYNELVHDLLDPASPSLQLRENIKRGIFVENLREIAVSSAADAYAVLNRGWSNRKVAETTMNHESSRSHAVFTVNIETKVNKGGVWAIKSSQLHLVDLAGSERQKDTNTSGMRLKEAGNINRSLSTLGNVIMALVDISRGKTRHIPYRDSKLTFLLKDSLGGNSRTCIIACVHPGSKCFGETLSTLQFAKRAKLIKNKAIVNEDMQGSVIHLQAEIKRLKEQLAHYQLSGTLQSGGINISCDQLPVNDADDGSSNRFQSFFVQAMILWQQLNNEKQALVEKCQCMEETCCRKDKALSQFKMILKFREEALRRIEKSFKEKSSIDAEDKNSLIESLRAEIRSFESIVNHHPEVTKYKLESESLKNEIQRLRAFLAQSIDNINLTELEKVFLEISESKGSETKPVSIASSPAGQSNSLASAAAVDRYKLQIEELEKKLADVKTESAQECQRLQRKQIEAEAEIAGLLRAKEEMEKMLKAHHVRTKIERDLHSDTIKTITTPKKSAGLTRDTSRVSLASAGGQSPDLVSSTLSPVRALYPIDTEFITNQTPPDQLAEQQIEGLREEVNKLQEQLVIMEADLKQKEQSIVDLCQEKSRLDTQHQLLDQMTRLNEKNWLASQTEMQQRIASLEKQNVELTSTNNILNSECQDLRIMNTAGDRKINELRAEMQLFKSSMDKELSKLETDTLKLTVERNELRESFDCLSEENEQLKEQEETLQATLDFTTDRLREVEEQLEKFRAEVDELNASIKTSERTVESLKREKELLLTQLKQETWAKDSQLLEAMQQLEAVRDELTKITCEKESLQNDLNRVEQLLSEAKAESDLLTKTGVKREEAINSLKEAIAELREAVAQRDSAIATQREESVQQISRLESDILELKRLIDSLNSTHAAELQQQAALASLRNAELEMLKEDNESLTLRVESFAHQLNDEVQQKAVLMARSEEHVNNISQLTAKVNELQLLLDEAKRVQEEQPEVINRCTILESQLRELQEAFDVVSDQHSAAASEASSAKRELINLQSCVMSMQNDHAKLDQQNHDLQQEQVFLREQIAYWEAECSKQKEQTLLALKDLTSLSAKLGTFESTQSNLQTENAALSGQLRQLTELNMDKDNEIARLAELVQQSFSNQDAINSKCLTLEEENCRLKEQISKLEDDLEQEIAENAKLTGHKNHAQRINYVERLKEQLISTEKRKKELEIENDRFRHMFGNRGTPQRNAP